MQNYIEVQTKTIEALKAIGTGDNETAMLNTSMLKNIFDEIFEAWKEKNIADSIARADMEFILQSTEFLYASWKRSAYRNQTKSYRKSVTSYLGMFRNKLQIFELLSNDDTEQFLKDYFTL